MSKKTTFTKGDIRHNFHKFYSFFKICNFFPMAGHLLLTENFFILTIIRKYLKFL